ncbi:hypothetical protein L7F22_024213 [Adiantum nelumboides]|nr:hypothetical protein [Adiantum nelumboides]
MALVLLCLYYSLGTLLISPPLAQALVEHLQEANRSSNFMHLPVGFNLSIRPINAIEGINGSVQLFSGVIVPSALDNGLFIPILNSPSFNSSSQISPGFSLGLFIQYTVDPPTSFMAICAGSWGRHNVTMAMSEDGNPVIQSSSTDGIAIPMWIANLQHPIQNLFSPVLVVIPDHGSISKHSSIITPQLQLRDGNHVLWNVSNVGMMEMRDSGDFLIYNASMLAAPLMTPGDDVAPVFQLQSPIRDTLIEGQHLTVGMQLTSSDAVYSAKMEKGGLALYLKGGLALYLNRMPGMAYWIFPLFREPDPKIANLSSNQLVSSTPYCSNTSHPPYLHVSSNELTQPNANLVLEPGSRSSAIGIYSYRLSVNLGEFDVSWSFLRLGTDGRLHLYAVYNSTFSNVSSHALDSDEIGADFHLKNGKVYSSKSVAGHPIFMQDVRTECDVPLACGRLGVCAHGVKINCSCPNQFYFEPRNETEPTQGCKRRTSLPPCTTSSRGMTNATIFVELKSTANIFLLNGPNFSSTSSDINACKRACSFECSCHGVSYRVSTSFCFLMTQEISLLSISDGIFRSWNYTATSDENLYASTRLEADDYVTYLKVASLPSASGPSQGSLKFSSHPFSMMVLVGIIPSGVLLCFLLGLGGGYLRNRRRRLQQQAKEEEELREILPLLPARFSYKELREATAGFSKLLGAGGCGSVYAGTLLDGRKVAVKVLAGLFQGANSQCKDFLAELATVGHTGHHNIVRLVGFCWQVSHRLLVYEFMERGSLDRWLFNGVSNNQLLDWEKRYNVVLGVAKGLHYLHEDCEQPILHFDIKPQNILLNDAFVAKLADFGMSRLMQRDASSVMTGVRGTPGYIAPEWFSHGTVSKKSDIYSMGVVMLEIVAGRKVLDYTLIKSSGGDDEAWHLPSWVAKRWEQGSLMDLVDKRLHVCGFDEVQVQGLLHIALWCIHEDPSMRPQAATVVQWLESGVDIPQPLQLAVSSQCSE